MGGSYSIKDVRKVLNVSRSTLVYYESMGIIAPLRTEGLYRMFSDEDILRLLSAITLKQTGVPLKDIPSLLNEDPFAPECFDTYLALVERRAEVCAAQRECLTELKLLRELPLDTPFLSYVEPYLISFDSIEDGYGAYGGDNESLGSLIENLPISGFGALCDRDLLSEGVKCRCGRTIAKRFAHLVDGLPPTLPTIGGTRCIKIIRWMENPVGFAPGVTGEAAQRMRELLDEHNLRMDGPAFGPYCLPSGNGTYALTCQPVCEA